MSYKFRRCGSSHPGVGAFRPAEAAFFQRLRCSEITARGDARAGVEGAFSRSASASRAVAPPRRPVRGLQVPCEAWSVPQRRGDEPCAELGAELGQALDVAREGDAAGDEFLLVAGDELGQS